MKKNKQPNSTIIKTMLYVSAFIPMYVLLLFKLLIEIINKNLTFNILNSIITILLIFLTFFGVLGVFLTINNQKLEKNTVKVVEFNNSTDQHFLSYFSLFVLFALTFELEKFSMAIDFILILVLIGLVYIKNNLFYINPFLNILGYSFYDVTISDQNGQISTLKIFYKGKPKINQTYVIKNAVSNFIIMQDKKTKN